MRLARGRKSAPETLPNDQCMYCNRIFSGTHAPTNPGKQVTYLDERGVYETREEAEAAGLDTSQQDADDFVREHRFSHGICPECYERERAKFLAEREERLKRQAEAEPAEGDV